MDIITLAHKRDMTYEYYLKFLIFKNMVEDLIEMFIKEFQKYNMLGIGVLDSWLFNQYVPNSKIIKGFLTRKKNIIVYTCGLNIKIRYMILEICII